MSNNGTRYKRTPQDSQEEYLVRIGWNMVGLRLWSYPNNEHLKLYYSKEKAIELSEELGLDMYCTACGACGIDGCCSPDRCTCLYRDVYSDDYKTLLEVNEKYHNFIKEVSEMIYVSVEEYADQAKKVLNDDT